MSVSGTAAYDACSSVPPVVGAALDLARGMAFANSCLPEQGELGCTGSIDLRATQVNTTPESASILATYVRASGPAAR